MCQAHAVSCRPLGRGVSCQAESLGKGRSHHVTAAPSDWCSDWSGAQWRHLYLYLYLHLYLYHGPVGHGDTWLSGIMGQFGTGTLGSVASSVSASWASLARGHLAQWRHLYPGPVWHGDTWLRDQSAATVHFSSFQSKIVLSTQYYLWFSSVQSKIVLSTQYSVRLSTIFSSVQFSQR